MTDIAAALTASIAKDGQTTATADLPMGTNKHTNCGDAAARNQYGAAGQVQDNDFNVVGSVSGTNTITGSLSPAITAYSAGMHVTFTPANNNTGAVTIALNGLTALDIARRDGVPLLPGNLVAGMTAYLVLDSGADDWTLLNPQAAEVPQSAQTGNYTLVIGDAGSHIYHASGAGAGDTYTIPANASVAFAIGTVITFINGDSNSISIAITSDTLTLAGSTSTGTRTLAQNGIATAIKVTATAWLINGTALS